MTAIANKVKKLRIMQRVALTINNLFEGPDDERCNGCKVCATTCASGGYQAIKMENQKAYIDVTRCDGCGLCVGVCPTEAVSLRNADQEMEVKRKG